MAVYPAKIDRAKMQRWPVRTGTYKYYIPPDRTTKSLLRCAHLCAYLCYVFATSLLRLCKSLRRFIMSFIEYHKKYVKKRSIFASEFGRIFHGFFEKKSLIQQFFFDICMLTPKIGHFRRGCRECGAA